MKFNVHVTGNTDRNSPPWPGTKVTTCMSYFTTGGPVWTWSQKATTNWKNLKGQKETPSPYVSPKLFQNLSCWNPFWLRDVSGHQAMTLCQKMTGQRQTRKLILPLKTWDYQPRAFSIRQESNFGPVGKDPPSCNIPTKAPKAYNFLLLLFLFCIL